MVQITLLRPISICLYFKFKIEDAITDVEEVRASTLALGDIYPNPASAITVIPVKGQPGSTIRMELRNNLGQLVDVLFEGRLTASEENHFLFADRYPAGTYYLQLVGEQMVTSQKVLIQ